MVFRPSMSDCLIESKKDRTGHRRTEADIGGNYELRRAKNRFSAIFPKISILRHILLHKVKIHMHMAIKHILLYRNSEKSLQPSWAEIQNLSDPEKGCGRKCSYCNLH